MRRSLIGLVAIAIVAGCAAYFPTTENYEAILKGWVGRSEEDLVKGWGAPSSVYQAANSKYLTYVKNKTCVGKEPYTCVCNTTFELASNRIASWRWDGNGCAALPRDRESLPFSTGRGGGSY